MIPPSPRKVASDRRRKAWGRLARRKSRAPASETRLYLISTFEAAGKWLASANGVAAGIGAALMVTAYGTLIPDFDDCIARHAASRAIQHGRMLMGFFLLGGIYGLAAASMPAMFLVPRTISISKCISGAVRVIFGRRLRLGSSRRASHDHRLGQGTTPFVMFCQLFFLAMSVAALAGLVMTVIETAERQTPDHLLAHYSALLVECGAPPPP